MSNTKPNNVMKMLVSTGIFLGTVAVALGISAGAASAGTIASCESGGDIHAQNPHSSASGKYQFIDSTWRAYGGGSFSSRASGASEAQQDEIFRRAYAAEGARPWAASAHCHGGNTGGAHRGGVVANRGSGKKPSVAVVRPKASAKAPAVVVVRPTSHQSTNAGSGDTITVKPGDTLSELFGANWREAAERNGLANPNLIYVGQKLH